ncbi:fatty acyl-CoA reductase wat-like [Drosophila bipectinata]|uniref:fatty acyl-CoA reductase wat-like n=1 Tax=Drosophila bipectinata TaxID=42026 RepID=UPI0038B2C6E9
METDIQSFYREKVIFITGATGFVGKVIIEKLLRSTDVKRIYVLIRPKRGREVQDRVSLWQKDLVFQPLLDAKPTAFDKVRAIAGDCIEPDLGISEEDRKLLTSEVQIVIHGAATVRFNQSLHVALAINTRATRLMIQLAKEMRNLQSYVHVSTAFSNCVADYIEERFHTELLTRSSDQVLSLFEKKSSDEIDEMTTDLLGPFPNSYTYTKALGEDVVLREAENLPICIFRPAIIIASFKEPTSGWIDNLYGPIAITYGVAYGVLRVVLLDVKQQNSVVPVDYCANMALALARETAQKKASQQNPSTPPIYNFAPSEGNLLTYGDFRAKALKYGSNYPVTNMIWYPFLLCIRCPWLFSLAAFLLHTVPGYFIDLALKISGRKPRLGKIYEKIHTTIKVLGPFSCRSWKFEMANKERLWQSMSREDQTIFNFDMLHLDWDQYFSRALCGMRLYLGKEPPTTQSYIQGQKRLRMFHVIHRLAQALLIYLAYLTIRTLLKLVSNLF